MEKYIEKLEIVAQSLTLYVSQIKPMKPQNWVGAPVGALKDPGGNDPWGTESGGIKYV